MCRGLAAQLEPDGRLLVVLSAQSGFEVLAAVRENGRIALNVTLPETYQSMSLLGRDGIVATAAPRFARWSMTATTASARNSSATASRPHTRTPGTWRPTKTSWPSASRRSGAQPDARARRRQRARAAIPMSAQFDDGLSLFGVRRMMEGVVPPTLCTFSVDHMPNVSYLSVVEYIDPLHIALSYQFFNRSRENVLATKRAALTMDDPYTGAGVVLQIEYLRTETEGPVFERLRAKLMSVASHVGMDEVFHLRGADVYRVLELRRVPGRKALPAAAAARRYRRRIRACCRNAWGTARNCPSCSRLFSTVSTNCCASKTRCCGCSTPRTPCSRCSRAAVTRSAAPARKSPPAKASSAPRCAKACRSASAT